MITISQCATIICSASLLLAWSAPAKADETLAAATSCGSLTKLERRIVDKANRGMPELRRFVSMTHFIYGVDMIDVTESLDKWRANATCATNVAEAAQKHE